MIKKIKQLIEKDINYEPKVKSIRNVSGIGNMQKVYSLSNPDIVSRSPLKLFTYKELINVVNHLKKNKPKEVNIGFSEKTNYKKRPTAPLSIIDTREDNLERMIKTNNFQYVSIYHIPEDRLRKFYNGEISLALEANGYIRDVYYENEEDAVEAAKDIMRRYGEYYPSGIDVDWVLLWRGGDEADRKNIKKVK